MLCPSCNIERKMEDFFKKDRCYKCIYIEKTKIVANKKCIVCGDFCSPERLKYCSEACMAIVAKEKKKNFWTKKLNSPINQCKKNVQRGQAFGKGGNLQILDEEEL